MYNNRNWQSQIVTVSCERNTCITHKHFRFLNEQLRQTMKSSTVSIISISNLKICDSVSPECRPLHQPDSCNPQSKWKVTAVKIAEVSASPALIVFDRFTSHLIGKGFLHFSWQPNIFFFTLEPAFLFSKLYNYYSWTHTLCIPWTVRRHISRWKGSVCKNICIKKGQSFFVCHCLSRELLDKSGLAWSLSIIRSGGTLLAIISAVRGLAVPPPKHISLCQLTRCLWMESWSMKPHATVIII